MWCRHWGGQTVPWKGVPCHQTTEDLMNYFQFVNDHKPDEIVEIGPGEGGTLGFLRDVAGCQVLSVGEGETLQLSQNRNRLVILDGDVYSQGAIRSDLERYAPVCGWLVVCHTVRDDWGSGPALDKWLPLNPQWCPLEPRFPTRHTWLKRD